MFQISLAEIPLQMGSLTTRGRILCLVAFLAPRLESQTPGVCCRPFIYQHTPLFEELTLRLASIIHIQAWGGGRYWALLQLDVGPHSLG